VETPPPEPAPDPSKGPPNQAILDALDGAVADLNRIRQQVIDFEGPAYFPEDWKNAESQFQAAGEQAKKDTQGDAQASLERYKAAAGTYGEILRKTLPRYADARKKEIQEARDAAVHEGIQSLSPKHLLAADEKALEALRQYEGEEYYAAAASAALALDMYRLLKTGTAAYHIREEIVRQDFIPYDPRNFEKADTSGLAAIAAYEEGRTEGLQGEAENIQSLYALVLKTGWISFAAERGAAAASERQAALDVKANVATRKDFDAASVVYNQAEGLFKKENYPEAAGLYVQAEYQFANTAKNAEEKRRAAEIAIKLAEEKMVESDEKAQQAELEIEGGGSL
jgi:hypothetical protein